MRLCGCYMHNMIDIVVSCIGLLKMQKLNSRGLTAMIYTRICIYMHVLTTYLFMHNILDYRFCSYNQAS